jgi:TusA-related sulfurtransferase
MEQEEMTTTTVPNITLDLTGLQNPEPILKLAEAATEWRAGDTVRVLADDECFANDFLRWCVGCDLDLLSLRYLPSGETELKLRMPRGASRLSA